MVDEDRVDAIADDVCHELVRAMEKFAPMHSGHEGYAVILEELDELWELVKANKPRSEEARTEAIHIAAMAMRYVYDLGPSAP